MGQGFCRRMLLGGRRVLWALLPCIVLCVYAGSARADTTVTVNTTSDSPSAGQCSLREAVAYADGTVEGDCASTTQSGTTTINIPGGTYTLSGSGLSLTRNAVLNGAGASSTTISGGNAVQVLNIAASVQVTINGVTISKGNAGNPRARAAPSSLRAPAAPATTAAASPTPARSRWSTRRCRATQPGQASPRRSGSSCAAASSTPNCSSRSGGTGRKRRQRRRDLQQRPADDPELDDLRQQRRCGIRRRTGRHRNRL